jgi:hypothetical protein
MTESTPIVAFDQHAATTVAAVLLPSQRTPALHSLASDSPTILRFVARLRRHGPLQCCYEAGPCGFELQRALTSHGVGCAVIAPALIPRRPAIGSRPIGGMRASWPCSIGLAHSRPFTFRASRKRRRAISSAVAKTFAPICCGRSIDSRNVCCVTAGGLPAPKGRGRAGTPRGSRRSSGHSRRSSKHTERMSGPLMRRSADCRPSTPSCAICCLSSR